MYMSPASGVLTLYGCKSRQLILLNFSTLALMIGLTHERQLLCETIDIQIQSITTTIRNEKSPSKSLAFERCQTCSINI